MITEGQKIPSFELPDSTGGIISSSDLKGKKCAIYFYPKDFTPGCTIQADEFSKEYKKFQKAKIDIIGISPDDATSHEKFCKKMNIPYPLLADTQKVVSKKFNVWAKKKFMGKEYMGVIRSTFLINESGEIFKIFSKVKPAGHAQAVLDAFKK